MAGRMLYGFGSGDMEELMCEARERRKCVNRVSELRTGGKLSIRRSFLLFVLFLLFSSLVHPSSLLWILARDEWRRQGFYHLRISANGRWRFPVHQIRRKVALGGTDQFWDLRVHEIWYVERSFDYSILFSSMVLAFAAQEVCA